MSTPISITPIAEVTLGAPETAIVSIDYNVGAQSTPLLYQSIVVGNGIDTGEGGGGTPGECPELSWQLFPRR